MYNDPYQTQKPKTGKIITLTLLGLVLAGALGFGGYYIGSQANKTANTTQNTNQNQTNTTAQPTYHTVVATGHPFNTSKTVTTKLALPNSLQAVAVSSSIQDPGYTTHIANKFNEEMGRWKIGNPTVSQTSYGDLSLIHIGEDWLQQASTEPGHPDEILVGLNFTTAAQKTASLATLEKETKECATNNAKGFLIAKTLNVCYSVTIARQAQGVYNPHLAIKGYGVIDNQKYVLAGWIALGDDSKISSDEADKKAQQIVDGTIPKDTQKYVTEYIDALKMTTITSAAQ